MACFSHRRQSHLCIAVGTGDTEDWNQQKISTESQKADVPASFKEKNLSTIIQSAEAWWHLEGHNTQETIKDQLRGPGNFVTAVDSYLSPLFRPPRQVTSTPLAGLSGC